MPRNPTPPELREAFEMFSRTLTGCFALYTWKTQLFPLLQPHRNEIGPYIVIGQNAAAQSSLVCIRSLDDFFRHPDTVQSDNDVIAHDFGFTQLGSVLGEERQRINRMIVHMSYDPLWAPADYAGPSGDGSFDLPALLGQVVARSAAFLDYCPSARVFSGTNDFGKFSALKRLAENMLLNAQTVGQLEREQER